MPLRVLKSPCLPLHNNVTVTAADAVDHWLLQVVELPREGPEAALKLFGGLPNLRLLVIGGDGTAAWIMSCIDSIQVHSSARHNALSE